MDQKTLFYNVIQDIWKGCKNLKKKKEMTDEDWSSLISYFSETSKKYGRLGIREQILFNEISYSFIDYVEREGKIPSSSEDGKIRWVLDEVITETPIVAEMPLQIQEDVKDENLAENEDEGWIEEAKAFFNNRIMALRPYMQVV